MLISAVYLLVVCAVATLVYWAVGQLGTPEPVARIVRVATIVIAALICISLIVQVVQHSSLLSALPA